MARRRTKRRYTKSTRRTYRTPKAPSLRSFLTIDPYTKSLVLGDSFKREQQEIHYDKKSTPKNNSSTKSGQIRFTSPEKTAFRNNTFIQTQKADALLAEKTLICKRRQTRNQIIHALGHAGKGGQNKPNITPQSKIQC